MYVCIKEEGKLLKSHIKYIKEEVKALIAANKRTAEKISQLEDECNYDTEEELGTHKENNTFVEDKIFEDFKEMHQIEWVEGELLYVCNVCDEGLNTEGDVKTHLDKYHKEILQNISKESKAGSTENSPKWIKKWWWKIKYQRNLHMQSLFCVWKPYFHLI